MEGVPAEREEGQRGIPQARPSGPGRRAKAVASGGVLLVEGETATLNLITIQPATEKNSTGTSTTVAIPLALENGQWKIAQ